MYIKIFIIAILFCLTSSLYSQAMSPSKQERPGFSANGEYCFSQHDRVANLGIGIGGYGLPLHGSVEYFILNDLSVGANVNVSNYQSQNLAWIGAMANYHFNRLVKLNIDNVDFYGGVSLGYFFSNGLNGVSGSSIYTNLQFGGRYFFNQNLGAFLEFGGGKVSGATIGVTLKF